MRYSGRGFTARRRPMSLPADQIPVGAGLDPNGQPDAAFFIDRPILTHFEEYGPDWKYHDARFVIEVVSAPDAIFEGAGRHISGSQWCYSVRPTRDPLEPDVEYQ